MGGRGASGATKRMTGGDRVQGQEPAWSPSEKRELCRAPAIANGFSMHGGLSPAPKGE